MHDQIIAHESALIDNILNGYGKYREFNKMHWINRLTYVPRLMLGSVDSNGNLRVTHRLFQISIRNLN